MMCIFVTLAEDFSRHKQAQSIKPYCRVRGGVVRILSFAMTILAGDGGWVKDTLFVSIITGHFMGGCVLQSQPKTVETVLRLSASGGFLDVI